MIMEKEEGAKGERGDTEREDGGEEVGGVKRRRSTGEGWR